MVMLACGLLLALPGVGGAADLAVQSVRYWSLQDVTRIAVETNGAFTYRTERLSGPDRVFYDLKGARPPEGRKGLQVIPVNDARVKQIRVAKNQPGTTRIVLDLEEGPIEVSASQLAAPDRLVVELRLKETPPARESKLSRTGVQRIPQKISEPETAAAPAVPPAAPRLEEKRPETRTPDALQAFAVRIPEAPAPAAPGTVAAPPASPPADVPAPRAARRNSNGDRSLTRALGLKVRRVVLDAGHGGHDHGTTGPGGLVEKELVLDVTRRLGVLIEEGMGSEVVFTRQNDTFVALEDRVALANERRADLFLSVHANSSPLKTASGAETYYLSFTPSRAAMEIAARENATSQRSISELRELVTKIAMKDKVDESREFAGRVQTSLIQLTGNTAKGGRRDRGVKRAPFLVLVGASMPAILAEIGFVTNPKEETLMKKPEYRQRLAEALYKGVHQYAESLSQFQVAQSTKRSRGE